MRAVDAGRGARLAEHEIARGTLCGQERLLEDDAAREHLVVGEERAPAAALAEERAHFVASREAIARA